jgi:2-polyprenyl-3-methyl-5-hydroxy-6-metoxy-1,4-benzoquinol methylase
MSLPQHVEVSGERFDLHYPVPNIFTQKQSREFGIYWSKHLEYGILYPQPTDDELHAFYDTAPYADYWAGKKNTARTANFLQRTVVKIAYLADHGSDDPLPQIMALSPANPTICDIGCGSGEFLISARARGGATVIGVDPSELSGKTLTQNGIEFHKGTAEQLPEEMKDRHFDIVTMFSSLEHCRDPALALRNVRSLVKRGGVLVIDVPNIQCLGFKLYRQAWWHTDAGRHLAFFTARSLQDMVSLAGFRPIEVKFWSFTRQFTPQWISDMQNVWDEMFVRTPRNKAPLRPSMLKTVAYLLPSIVCGRRYKYDMVRLFGTPHQ